MTEQELVAITEWVEQMVDKTKAQIVEDHITAIGESPVFRNTARSQSKGKVIGSLLSTHFDKLIPAEDAYDED